LIAFFPKLQNETEKDYRDRLQILNGIFKQYKTAFKRCVLSTFARIKKDYPKAQLGYRELLEKAISVDKSSGFSMDNSDDLWRKLGCTTEESFEELISNNLKGPYFLTQDIANWMIEQKASDKSFEACIINISSISATVASVNRGDYCLSKAGISMATQLFAVRLGEYNIPVYEVRPGIISTDMTLAAKEKYDRLINEGLCVQRRWGLPEDIGKIVGALALGSFPYSTGQVFMADGGMTIPRL
jgi:NAD(P)-dependent dehydrogenase (short-subunit alcohol dehydrogenase family)